jgi:lysophospholipase L1-like esterase
LARIRLGISLLLAALAAAPACDSAAAAPAPASRWVGAWTSAQTLVDPPNALPVTTQKDVTLRQLVRVGIGGTRVRIRLSNAFGTSPLEIAGASVARAVSPGASGIDPATQRSLTFAGERSIVIPAGADYVSDPVALDVPAESTLAVSLQLPELPKVQTGHPGSRATSYVAPGDQLAAAQLEGAIAVEHWYFLSEVDVEAREPSAAIAILGDSITDGHGVEANTNQRWTDFLLDRLKATPATRSLAVLNLGIGGNRLIDDGLGPNAVARFGRDVLARSGVRYLIILEGVNDLGVLTRDHPVSAAEHQAFVRRVLAGYSQIVARARERGIKVIGATIMPYGGSAYYHPGPPSEADRQAVNRWIRARHVDAVLDFDALMRDPARPDRLRKEYDSDGLHPSIAGYKAMGDAVPLTLFRRAGTSR